MTSSEYNIIRVFLSQSCGIELGDNKQYLVNNRLSALLIKFDLSSFSDLVNMISQHSAAAVKVKEAIIDAMTTNETFWFRDDMQFEELRKTVFPEIFARKPGSIKVWSAACSSGQEPYTISMCVEDVEKQTNSRRNVQIIGTDISETILAEAKKAVYSELALSRGLDVQTKSRFFQQSFDGYKLNPEIAGRVRFQQFNLLKPFSVLGKFDVVFCRNVLIYFSEQVKRDILTRMASSLEPGGCLFLSSTESMPATINAFEVVRCGRIRYFVKK